MFMGAIPPGASKPVPVEVGATNIFARAAGGRQFLVYGMNIATPIEVAMVLPLPVPLGSSEDAVRFLDLRPYPTFFRDVNACFAPVPLPQSRLLSTESCAAVRSPLPVFEAGDFEASFVPSPDDWDRIDPRFRLPPALLAALPQYSDWGFAVLQLRDVAARGGYLKRWSGHSQTRTIHPIALDFPRRDPNRVFFPTVHVHDGTLHEHGDFDHVLYWQGDAAATLPTDAAVELVDTEPSSVAWDHVDVERTLGIVVGDAPFFRRTLRGRLANRDHWLELPSD